MDREFKWLVALLLDSIQYRDPNPARSYVTGLDHMLQTATYAEKAGSPPSEIIMALVHDAARPLNDVYHGEVIAQIMANRLPPNEVNALRLHGECMASPKDVKVKYGNKPWYKASLRLLTWDSMSFDPSFVPQPLEHFTPILKSFYN